VVVDSAIGFLLGDELRDDRRWPVALIVLRPPPTRDSSAPGGRGEHSDAWLPIRSSATNPRA
jgi:hypothetical protein